VSLVDRYAALPALLLGFVAFMLGERLTLSAIVRQRWILPFVATLALLLPLATVALPAYYWVGVPSREAIVLGIFAMAGAPATVLALGRRLKASGTRYELLATLAAADNVIVVIAYGVAAPFLIAPVAENWTLTAALLEVAISLGIGTLLGVVGGWVLWFMTAGDDANRTGQLITSALLVVISLTAISQLVGASGLIACAVAGVIVATVHETRGASSTFKALSRLEDLVYVFFFIFAGAEIIPRSLTIAGLLALVYVLGRAGGKIVAGTTAGILRRDPARETLLLGLALLPQAGVVVGLALDADVRFPTVGSEVLSVVMASLVLFELVGPLALSRALARFSNGDGNGEDDLQARPDDEAPNDTACDTQQQPPSP